MDAVGGLLHRHIFACRFTQMFARLRHIENVVNHLKSQPDVVTEVQSSIR